MLRWERLSVSGMVVNVSINVEKGTGVNIALLSISMELYHLSNQSERVRPKMVLAKRSLRPTAHVNTPQRYLVYL